MSGSSLTVSQRIAIGEAVAHARLLTHELAEHSLAAAAHAMHAEHLGSDEDALVGVRRAEVLQHLFDCGWPRQMLEWKQRDAKEWRSGSLPVVGNSGRPPTLALLALTDPTKPRGMERSVSRRFPVWRVHLGFLHHQSRFGVHKLKALRLSHANIGICRRLEVLQRVVGPLHLPLHLKLPALMRRSVIFAHL